MYSKLISVGSALLLGSALTFTAAAQDNAAEKAREQSIDTASQQNAQHEPHMAAALQHLRQAEEELEKASPNKGGHLVRAMELTKQAEAQVNEGMQYYNQNVSPLNSAAAQESTAENAREQQVDTAATGNMSKQPSMAAALSHLRQAEEELEKANNEHGGFRAQALQQVQQAEATVVKGLQWYNTNVLNKDKKK